MAVMRATKVEAGRIDPAPSNGLMKLARSAGALYLVNIIGGAFAISIVPALLFGSDPAATAHNIQSHELLYRSGLAAHVLVTVTNIFLALIFYELFKVVNRRLALLDVFFILVATAIEAAGLVNQFAPLVLLGSGPYANALPAAQLQALAHLPRPPSSLAYKNHTVLYSFTAMLAPGFASNLVPWIQLPALFGEGSLCLWLLVAGVNVERWKQWASAATRMRATQVEAL